MTTDTDILERLDASPNKCLYLYTLVLTLRSAHSAEEQRLRCLGGVGGLPDSAWCDTYEGARKVADTLFPNNAMRYSVVVMTRDADQPDCVDVTWVRQNKKVSVTPKKLLLYLGTWPVPPSSYKQYSYLYKGWRVSQSTNPIRTLDWTGRRVRHGARQNKGGHVSATTHLGVEGLVDLKVEESSWCSPSSQKAATTLGAPVPEKASDPSGSWPASSPAAPAPVAVPTTPSGYAPPPGMYPAVAVTPSVPPTAPPPPLKTTDGAVATWGCPSPVTPPSPQERLYTALDEALDNDLADPEPESAPTLPADLSLQVPLTEKHRSILSVLRAHHGDQRLEYCVKAFVAQTLRAKIDSWGYALDQLLPQD